MFLQLVMKPHHIQPQNCVRGEVMSISQPSGFSLLAFHPMNSRDELSHGKAERHARQLTARITRRTLFQITPLDCHPQTQSPLFSILPPELRNQIFELAVSQFEDRTKPFPENTFWYRPDHHYELRTETSLLRTCRLIYYETSVIPMRSATHHFYYNRGPKDLPVDNYLHHLARKEQDNLYHLHFFASVASWDFEYLRKLLYLPFKKVTLSLRHSDWLGWKSDTKLWLGNINHELLLPHSCQEFILELETLQQKKHQLDEIVQRAVTWEFQADDGAVFICETDRLVTSWTGRSDLNDIHWEVHGPGPTISYHIVKLRWRLGKLVVTDNLEQLSRS